MNSEAVRMWQVLISCASNRQTITYGELARRIGWEEGSARGAGAPLEQIAQYCQGTSLPWLTVIVVRADTGRPGEGYTGPADIDVEREEVFSYPWFAAPPP